ncbi:MAG TPA: hypothetical protein PLI06_00865 [Methanofastidiosum sp.]|nr:hypothetical protein [Methanofastidiosum sp.]
MNKILAITLSMVLLLAGVGMLYAKGGNYIQVYDNSISSCQRELLIYDLDIPSIPYTFNLERCIQPAALSGVCLDCTVEPPINLGRCEYTLSNYRCELMGESFWLYVYYDGSGTITVNGRNFDTSEYPSPLPFLIYDSQEEDPDPRVFSQIPSSVTISSDGQFTPGEFGIILERECCWNCVKKSFPAAILYPKVDIESFNVEGGPQVIKDGKVLSEFKMSPGSQNVFLQVENRGFFTQNDARVRFEGLPEGVTVNITPETQTINAHNIGTYSANFTVGPNVPSSTYQVTMVAFSPNGVFDIITFEFVVP